MTCLNFSGYLTYGHCGRRHLPDVNASTCCSRCRGQTGGGSNQPHDRQPLLIVHPRNYVLPWAAGLVVVIAEWLGRTWVRNLAGIHCHQSATGPLIDYVTSIMNINILIVIIRIKGEWGGSRRDCWLGEIQLNYGTIKHVVPIILDAQESNRGCAWNTLKLFRIFFFYWNV